MVKCINNSVVVTNMFKRPLKCCFEQCILNARRDFKRPHGCATVQALVVSRSTKPLYRNPPVWDGSWDNPIQTDLNSVALSSSHHCTFVLYVPGKVSFLPLLLCKRCRGSTGDAVLEH